MNMKVRFRVAVVIVAIALVIVLAVQVRTDSTVPLTEGEVGFFNLLIDIVAGVFTVWGLYWAASEFAGAQVKPDLHLVIGREKDDMPFTSEADALTGVLALHQDDPAVEAKYLPQVGVNLFLENTRPKAARYVQVVLCVRDIPPFKYFEVWLTPYAKLPRAKAGDGQATALPLGEARALQLGEDFIVYKGESAYCGTAFVIWPEGIQPEKITFVAKLYSLDSEPKEVIVPRPIHWIERAS
jgi:hypothetical protein